MTKVAGRYNRQFFTNLNSADSSEVLAQLLVNLLQPASVMDVGCGTGQLLAAFTRAGVTEITGIDGPWVPRDLLQIPPTMFETHDLSQPYYPSRQYDLVTSVEVAEHLPQDAADTFVDTVTGLGQMVAFGAAIPLQGGTHHINEQWPAYWAKLFAARGYLAIDCLRPRLISDPQAPELLAQNIILYVHQELVPTILPLVTTDMQEWTDHPLPVVHPRQYLRMKDFIANAPSRVGLTKILKALPALVAQGLSARFGRRTGD